ncbi:MAG TPA: class I tRNA ligase family protein, partial [bacterium]|nr:class I tRNA ligase family protein [bacterium]
VLKITKYADRLIEDLDLVDYLERIKTQQVNWIGKSIGAEIRFKIYDLRFKNKPIDELTVFTTRPDTLFGATFMVVAPEHSIINNQLAIINNKEEVLNYIEEAKKKSDLERTDLNKEKTGVEIKGIKAINPVNGKEIPIFVADYVMMGYGTGAIMAVPAHDERDFEFAKKYGLEIKRVVGFPKLQSTPINVPYVSNEPVMMVPPDCYIGEGVAINSDFLNGLETQKAIEKMTEWLEEKNIGKKQVQYKLHDWIFSRQRYWGEPIPMVYCEKCAKAKHTFVIVHGFTGHSQENWFPWFKQEMEKMGAKVIVPDMPNTNSPTLEEWVKYLGLIKDQFEGELTLIGHSLGAPAVCKFIEKNDVKLKRLVLIAPAARGYLNLQGLQAAGFEKKDLKVVDDFFQHGFEWNKIKNKSDDSLIYISEDDPYIQTSVVDYYKELQARIKIFPNKGHFSSSKGEIYELPELINEFYEMINPGWQTVLENELPVVLPEIDDYLPTDEGDSPLAKKEEWVKTKCPVCGGEARRETDVMPNWAGSNWYFIRYTDPKNNQMMVDPERAKYWLPVDWYNGGMEHTTLHLLYSRFVWKFLYDIGAVPKECGVEPYAKRTAHGMILGEGGVKMSKSKGNVINPDEYVKKYGADTLRVYEMFMGPFDQPIAWEDKSVNGVYRFLNRIWNLQGKLNNKEPDSRLRGNDKRGLETLLHQTIKKVGEDIEEMKFNTAVAQMMILVNELEKQDSVLITHYSLLITLLSPFAPHLAEEVWQNLGHQDSIQKEKWPEYDPRLIRADEFELVVQINGKVREKITVPAEISETEVKELVLKNEKVLKWLLDKEPKKIIYIKGKLLSVVV